jgi:hypothetical protein
MQVAVSSALDTQLHRVGRVTARSGRALRCHRDCARDPLTFVELEVAPPAYEDVLRPLVRRWSVALQCDDCRYWSRCCWLRCSR